MDLDRTRAAYKQIAAEMIKRIRSGAYGTDAKLPSVVELANEFGVVNSTAARAMTLVREAGLTRAEPGLGTYVLPPGEWPNP
jgi:DNA-binding transcriptional regulator YhcF (GntR family)